MPTTGFAAIDWTSPEGDQSIHFLGIIFGSIGNVLFGQGNQLLGELFRIFNVVVLSLGTVIIMYTIIVSTMNTAQEGDVMGRKWSSAWIPIRAAMGLAFLLPTNSGYSLIQITITWILLQGIHAGNAVYNVILTNAEQGGSLNQNTQVDDDTLTTAALEQFYSLVCMHKLNSQDYQSSIKNQQAIGHIYNGQFVYGVPGDPELEAACGGLTPSSKNSEVKSRRAWDSAQLQAAESAHQAMLDYAAEAQEVDDPQAWVGRGVIGLGRNAMRAPISNTPTGQKASQDLQKILNNARADGWIFAGSYYYQLIQPKTERGTDLSDLTFTAPNVVKRQEYLPFLWDDVKKTANRYLTVTDLDQSQSSRKRMGDIGSAHLDKEVGELWKAIGLGNAFSDLAKDFMDYLTENDKDPIVSFGKLGSSIMISTEMIWFSVIGITFLLMIPACVWSSTNPMCLTMTGVLSLLIPVLTFMLALLWTAGVAIGLYLPLVPYIVYTFTALGWLILAIEAIVAGPIVALGIVSPAQDALGKASSAILLVTGVFLRPSLMVIGFVASARLLIAVVHMINFGFASTVNSATGGLGLFGSIAMVVVYAGIVMTAVHQCFSLIYKLPDNIMRWIGGQAEQSKVEQATQEIQSSSENAAKTSADGMKQGSTFAQESKQKLGGGGGGGGGGAGKGGGGSKGGGGGKGGGAGKDGGGKGGGDGGAPPGAELAT
jgi:uncharacterized membrane protein YgcG